MANRLVELALVFAPLSFFTIGGGQTVIADFQRQFVDVHQWMTASEFLNAFAITRMTPGPGAVLATLLGWRVAGWAGALVATRGIFGPTAFLAYAVARVRARHQGRRWLVACERGLLPVATGLIFATTWVLFASLDGGWPARVIAIGATAVLFATNVNALVVMAGSAAAYVAWAMLVAA